VSDPREHDAGAKAGGAEVPPARAAASGAARLWRWWPVLVPPLAVPAVYAAHALGWDHLIAKAPQEIAALVLMPVAAIVFAVRWAAGRRPLHLVLAALSIAFLCREIHFPGTEKGVYVAVGLIGVWAFLWRRRLLGSLLGRPAGRWLIVVMWSYFLALLVQRRAFRFLPDEQALHVQFEELLENVSHLLLVVLGLV